MLPRRDMIQTVLVLAGLVVSLAIVGLLCLSLWGIGHVLIEPSLGIESSPDEKLLGYIAHVTSLIIAAIALRSHVLAAQYIVGKRDNLSPYIVFTGFLSSILGSNMIGKIITAEFYSQGSSVAPVIVISVLLDISVIATWGYIAFKIERRDKISEQD